MVPNYSICINIWCKVIDITDHIEKKSITAFRKHKIQFCGKNELCSHTKTIFVADRLCVHTALMLSVTQIEAWNYNTNRNNT